MKARVLYQVSVRTTPDSEDAIVDLLSEVFSQPASTYTNVRTGRSSARVYLSSSAQCGAPAQKELKEGLRRIRSVGLCPGPLRTEIRRLPAEDWAESWKLHFKPLEIGTELLIKPSWSRRKPRKNQALVVLDPGLSFGTGQHPTTHFCLEQLVAARNPNLRQSLLDAGCGSGILAIAGAKLGYSPVQAFDFDPEAVRIARQNAKNNGVARAIRISRQDLTRMPVRPARQFDLVCANLTSDLLVTEMPRILARLKKNGRLVLAGILANQFHEVQTAAVGQGLRMVAQARGGEWKSGAFLSP